MYDSKGEYIIVWTVTDVPKHTEHFLLEFVKISIFPSKPVQLFTVRVL